MGSAGELGPGLIRHDTALNASMLTINA